MAIGDLAVTSPLHHQGVHMAALLHEEDAPGGGADLDELGQRLAVEHLPPPQPRHLPRGSVAEAVPEVAAPNVFVDLV